MTQGTILVTIWYSDPILTKVNIACGTSLYLESYLLAEDGQILLTEIDNKILTEQQ